MRRKAITFIPGALTIAPPPYSGGNTAPANTQQSQPTSTGMFGAAPAASSQAQPSGGLFGAANPTTQPQQSGGLFGAAAAPQPAKPTLSLFGNNTANTNNTQPQQQTGGLFGNNAPYYKHSTTVWRSIWKHNCQQQHINYRRHVWKFATACSAEQAESIRCREPSPKSLVSSLSQLRNQISNITQWR
jgi:hypothetical protein